MNAITLSRHTRAVHDDGYNEHFHTYTHTARRTGTNKKKTNTNIRAVMLNVSLSTLCLLPDSILRWVWCLAECVCAVDEATHYTHA